MGACESSHIPRVYYQPETKTINIKAKPRELKFPLQDEKYGKLLAIRTSYEGLSGIMGYLNFYFVYEKDRILLPTEHLSIEDKNDLKKDFMRACRESGVNMIQEPYL